MRKTQQLACYAAQEGLDRGPAFATIADAQKFVDGLRDTYWWQLHGYGLRVLRIDVEPWRTTKHNAQASFEPERNAGVIDLARSGMTTGTVLHEVAHVLNHAINGDKPAGHGPEWARLYLTLVSYVMGPDAYTALRQSFDKHGVDYHLDTPSRSGAIAL